MQLSFMNGPFDFCFSDLRTLHLLAVLLRDDPLEFKVMSTRDDSKRRFLARHSVAFEAMLQRYCNAVLR